MLPEVFTMKRLGFGLMRLPQTDPKTWASVDQEQVGKMTDAFLEKGFSYLKKIKRDGKAKNVDFSYHDGAAALNRILTSFFRNAAFRERSEKGVADICWR
jgi:predicted aldo/keto reductase-like oxidoreductase